MDGVVAVSVNPDASLCLRVGLGRDDRRPDLRIEIIIAAEDAAALFGAAGPPSATQSNCLVGLQLGSTGV
ncbi:hypothetical protein Dvina_18675 [Dactylosporangium vinaceum]|uniref:hypothetical protein n=1 Tax=Dactylosporangium vinaceum TaxID=53362 RepID=UPI001CA7E432|nr:hypothetical protein [Dactylosporangium vinaceum]UAB99901.1 hypothetical protein Dvina_18675 [Dactylosporangium vinaceum]